MREFNVTPDLKMIKIIKQAQKDGKIDKPSILKAAGGSIFAYNPLCMFKSELQEQIVKDKRGELLEVFPVSLIKTEISEPQDYVCVSSEYPATNDPLLMLNVFAKVIEKITNGEYGNIVYMDNIYVFVTYGTQRFDGTLTGTRSVSQNVVAVLPISTP